jgi:uncharacterized protein
MSRLPELVAKIDAFFARVEARHGADMQCGSGCSDCCHVRLTITGVEAQAIRDEVASWPVERRRALAPSHSGGPADRCAALDDAGRCKVYAARPLVCRSHGVPVRLGGLPVLPQCGHNFTRTQPAADCVLDQQTLSAILLAIDKAAGNDGSRFELADLVAALAAT